MANQVELDSWGPGFHEFQGLKTRERTPLQANVDERTFEQFVEDMEAAAKRGWEPEYDYRLTYREANFIAEILGVYLHENEEQLRVFADPEPMDAEAITEIIHKLNS